jgi:hypothetical protein
MLAVRGRRGRFVNVTGVAVIAMIIVAGDDGSVRKRVVVKLKRVRTTLLVALILDPSSATDLATAGRSHDVERLV